MRIDKRKISLFLILCFIPISILSKTFKYNLFLNYYYESIKLNTISIWNPDNFYNLENTHSNFSLNLESKLNFGFSKFKISPILLIDNQAEIKTGLRELNCTFNLGNFEITFGKSIIKMGTGYIFTPIGVITPAKKLSDPEDEMRTQEGVTMGKIDFYTENLNLSAIVFKKQNWENYALFAYYNFKSFDLYGILYYPEYKKLEYGFAFSTTLGEAVEIHSEFMIHKQVPVLYHKVYFVDDPETCFNENPLYNPGFNNYKEFVIGTNITIKGINIIAEYYHKDWGLKESWWDKLKKHYKYNFINSTNPFQSSDISADLSITKQGTMGLMRDYLFVRAWKPFNNTSVSAILYTNLKDLSSLFIFEIDTQICDNISFYLKPLFFLGKKDSEFREGWYNNKLEIGFRMIL